MPDAGRIRIGVTRKTQKGRDAPAKLDTFRFTSGDKASIEQVAALYGGEVRPWAGHDGQWEVISGSKLLKIALPPDPLGGTPIYEEWKAGGCVRRCDGVNCWLMNLEEPREVDCICGQKGVLECKLTTRLSVLLPEIRFLGVWRLDTHSWNAASELQGFVEAIKAMEARGIQRGELRLDRRFGAKGAIFIPALGFDASLNQLAEGGEPIAALPAGEMAIGEHTFDGWEAKVLEDPGATERVKAIEAELVGSGDHFEDMGSPPIEMAAYHADPAITQAYRDALTTTQQNKVLRMVRDDWGESGYEAEFPAPATFDDIPDDIIDGLIERGVT